MRGGISMEHENETRATVKSIGRDERRSNLAKVLLNRMVSTRKPKLGQNFLVDLDAMQRIVDALGDISETTVVEIGPGEAALTELLAKRAGRLIAVELDRVLAAQLRMRFTPLTNVEVLEADILQVDLGTVLGSTPGPLRDLRPTGLFKTQVVGNLPYYITTDILLKLFAAGDRIESLVLMVQKEVADRIVAAPGSGTTDCSRRRHRCMARCRSCLNWDRSRLTLRPTYARRSSG